ncbi:hypothetical protein [Paraclostridium bifermentans]|uniref:hypothetical protein n=1 Tax=Paraclostridium bifermentans TaxID=1490 RepID=UPI0022DF9672|nr:hypothetical protein [Paraclostridium bifermentans]
MVKKRENIKSQLLITFERQLKYKNNLCIIFFIILIGFSIAGIVFINNSLATFISSCAIGLCCSYITGWFISYLSDKQTACLLEIDYKISKIDELINDCKFETNIYSSMENPKKVNIYKLNSGSSKEYFMCLVRMGSVFNSIAECGIWDFSDIQIEFFTDDYNCEKIKLSEFEHRLNKYAQDQFEKFNKVKFSEVQCNNMFMNGITVIGKLNKIKEELIKEKEYIILKKKIK